MAVTKTGAICVSLLASSLAAADAFVVTQRSSFLSSGSQFRRQQDSSHKRFSRHYNDDDGAREEELNLDDQDWRAFRAKLVLGETSASVSVPANQVAGAFPEDCDYRTGECDVDGIGALFSDSWPLPSSTKTSIEQSLEGMTPLDPSQWAYDSGKIIEQGAVILGGVEQDFGFGLRQQYFHKAAILVLDHEESTFTKGIILNRPTNLLLDDDINPGIKWRVWFGGDVQGLTSDNPDIVCLHSLGDEQATRASVPIMKDLQWTTFANAKRLVQVGAAEPKDFWVFCGYAGWGPSQLMGELDRKSWYMVATDSGTLMKELARLGRDADPRNAGLDTWTLLMNMIGRGETAVENSGDFDDLMLKEWALQSLLSKKAGGSIIRQKKDGLDATSLRKDPVSRLISRASASAQEVKAGTLIRASQADRSPFMFHGQELHKSVVLVLRDDDNISVGVILNRPAAKSLDVSLQNASRGSTRTIKLPLRFGGQYSVQGSEPLLWLHFNPVLRSAGVGSPVGDQARGIWKCTAEDVAEAVRQGIALPGDFLVVTGVSIWVKGQEGSGAGLQGEVRSGSFEVIPDDQTQAVWDVLSKQEVLTQGNLFRTVEISDDAWAAGGRDEPPVKIENGMVSISGLGEHYEDAESGVVFNSDVKVSKLADDALRYWIAVFLLGSATLGGEP